MDKIITVLVVDDHPIMRQGVRALLDREMDIKVIAEAGNAEMAVQKALKEKPDVILMDLQLPGRSGLSAIAELRALNVQARILVFSNFLDEAIVQEAILAGATGFVQKIDSTDKLIQIVRNCMAPAPRNDEPRFSTPAPTEDASYQVITPREMDILRMISKGMPDQEIAAAMFISEGTVRTHISHILNKLGLQNRSQAVVYAIRHGMVNFTTTGK